MGAGVRPEDSLQASVATFLDRALPTTSWWTATANGAFLGGDKRRRSMQAGRLKRTGVKSGTPDLLLLCDGIFYAIELKTEKGKANDNQLSAMDTIAGAGGKPTIARSVEDVERFLRVNGVQLRASILPVEMGEAA